MQRRSWRSDTVLACKCRRQTRPTVRELKHKSSVHTANESEEGMSPRTLLTCLLVLVLGLVVDICAARQATVKPLSALEMAQARGGAPFTRSECESPTGAGACPVNVAPPRATCPAGSSVGAICPGTTYCSDTSVNWTCSAPYTTWDPFDLNCVVRPPSPCHSNVLTCIADGSCGGGMSGPNPVACGTVTECSY